jgi:hypothetical protein
MMKKGTFFFVLSMLGLFLLSGCASTRTENGVMIEKKRSANPLDYIPYL